MQWPSVRVSRKCQRTMCVLSCQIKCQNVELFFTGFGHLTWLLLFVCQFLRVRGLLNPLFVTNIGTYFLLIRSFVRSFSLYSLDGRLHIHTHTHTSEQTVGGLDPGRRVLRDSERACVRVCELGVVDVVGNETRPRRCARSKQ